MDNRLRARKLDRYLVTLKLRAEARTASLAIRAAIAEPSLAGERRVTHLKMHRPRRGVWWVTWEKLPGLIFDAGRRTYTHVLLPRWEYTVAEMKTEMLDDLDHFALTGEQPKVATTRKEKLCRHPTNSAASQEILALAEGRS